MKKWNAICMVTVLVIGMVFMSGCTSPVSTSSIPVAPTTQQIVYETVPVTPTPAPATAVLSSSAPVAPTTQQIVYETMPVTPTPASTTAVPAANDTGYDEPAFKDTNLKPPLSVEADTTGGLFINIRAGGSVDGLKVFIARDGTNVSPIEYSFLPDRSVVEGENKGYLQVKIPPDGRSELIKLLPGNYTAYLPNWNGGEPEEQSFMIREEDITPIWFAGFAASSGGCGC
jgi:hypothetical protein